MNTVSAAAASAVKVIYVATILKNIIVVCEATIHPRHSPEQFYLKIQDILLTNLDEVTNSRFKIDDVLHQGRAMLNKEDEPVQKAKPTLRFLNDENAANYVD